MAKYQEMIGGVKMPSVGLGTWQATNEQELEGAIDAAIEAGYRHIDTAYLYRNEHVIGKVLQKWFTSGKLKREDIFITTKLPSQGVFEDKVEYFIKESLKSLQLDYVDLYLIHTPIGRKPKEGEAGMGEAAPTDHLAVWKKMEEQVDAGRARTIGISNFNIRQIDRIIKNARIPPANLQVELSPYLQQPELVKFCHDNKIVVVGYSSLGNPGLASFMGKEIKRPAVLQDETLKQIASKHGKSVAQIILRFFVQKNIVMIPKSVTPERVKQNIDIFDFKLDDDDIAAIEKLDKGEAGRAMNPSRMDPKSQDHPEYPFPKIQL